MMHFVPKEILLLKNLQFFACESFYQEWSNL